jgi:signal transduction histidine kinase
MLLDGARNLLKRIDATIDIARIEAGGLTLESVDFGPATVLAETCGMLAHRAREKGLALQVSTAPDVPAVLKGDPTRLAQMVLNFLDNAIKFTEQGFVQVSATCVARDGAGVVLRVEVADSGPGIPVELQASLFTPFAPGDPSVTRRHGGLGVGLSTTREIARLMGGDAGVSSEPGKGSTFWLSARFLPGKTT